MLALQIVVDWHVLCVARAPLQMVATVLLRATAQSLDVKKYTACHEFFRMLRSGARHDLNLLLIGDPN
jgi:hypothetical protein